MSTINNKRIAKNTLMLYFRQILIMLVSLYTVRVVLNTLGVEDYGIYNVVGGIVMFFSFLSGTMASATQRFFSFALGEHDYEKLKRIFCINFLLYIAIALIAVLLLETVGLWFINTQLNVPIEKFNGALWIYHFSVLTFMAMIITAPFMAIIIAHEDMQIYAYVSIVEAVLKLGIVFLLVWLPWNKLEIYGVLLFIVAVINAILYITICMKKYAECQFKRIYFDRALLQETVGFTGWTLFGQITTVIRNQAVTILLNQLFNPVVVAARSIAVSVSNYINVFSNNFNTGLYPSIIKEYAVGNKKAMFSLIFNGSKITFFLMWIFVLPFLLEMNFILSIWLKNPPEGAVLFTQLALIEVLINSISLPIATAARAPGKMKLYELSLGSIQLSIFLFSWIALTFGAEVYIIFIIAIIANLLMFVVRLIIVHILIELPTIIFVSKVIVPICIVVICSGVLSFILSRSLPDTLIFVCIKFLASMSFVVVSMYFIGIDSEQRKKIWHLIYTKFHSKSTEAIK